MLRSETARTATPDGTRDQHSLGDLVGLALKDVSQLVRYEINLAKSEFKVDMRRGVTGGLFFAFILAAAYPMIIMLLFAEAYALMNLGAPGGRWGAFLWAALTCAVVAAIAGLIGFVFFKRVSGMKLTRKTVSDDIDMFKRATSSPDGDGTQAIGQGGAGTDGTQPAVTARPLAP
jgi:Na+/H+-dicarboxylate symporter